MRTFPAVWFTTCEEVARWHAKHQPLGDRRPGI
jgi:hypothetical protein